VVLCGCAGALLFAAGCNQPAAVDTGAAEQAVRDADAKWSKAAAARDVAGVVSFYADDAIVMPPNAPRITGKQAIHDEWAAMAVPGFDLSWAASKVEAASSGDLVYETGIYVLHTKDAKGTPVTDQGKILQVWKKQTDGSWKAVADMWNSDMPAAGVAPVAAAKPAAAKTAAAKPAAAAAPAKKKKKK
jgi:ketosteroid isomerase-like protein